MERLSTTLVHLVGAVEVANEEKEIAHEPMIEQIKSFFFPEQIELRKKLKSLSKCTEFQKIKDLNTDFTVKEIELQTNHRLQLLMNERILSVHDLIKYVGRTTSKK